MSGRKRGKQAMDAGEKKPKQDRNVRAGDPEDDLVFEDPYEDEFEDEFVEGEGDGEWEDEESDGDDMIDTHMITDEGEGGGASASTEGSAVLSAATQAALDKAARTLEKQEKKVDEEVEHKIYWPPIMGESAKMEGADGDVTMVHDSRAYDLIHQLQVEWPCLSFDIIKDQLGAQRKSYPMTVYLAAGTQAARSGHNKLMLMKLSQLTKTLRRFQDHEDADSDDEQGDDDEIEDDPILEHRDIAHPGCVNRLRCMPQQPTVIATWSEEAEVHVWDTSKEHKALDRPPTSRQKHKTKPLQTFKQHETDGFALDWSPRVGGRLLSGDSDHHIYLYDRLQGGVWAIQGQSFSAHTESVEDVQWSPSEDTVFASASVDQTIRIWDSRTKRTASALNVKAHDTDVNVIDWNHLVSYALVSGADDGCFKIWDLRSFKAPTANFTWHEAPITSVEWSPDESAALAVASADHQVTFWDLALEKDQDAEKTAATGGKEAPAGDEALSKFDDLPPQLLFVHMGINDPKEIHYHPQIPGLLVATSSEGFQVVKPFNI